MKPRVLELCTGMGLMGRAFADAGFEVVPGCEIDPDQRELHGALKSQHKGQDWSGVEACPVCDGKLHMSHAGINGHVWGKCETENCLAWME